MTIQSDREQHRLGRAQVFQAAGIVSTAFVLSRIVGLVRDAVIGYYYGATSVDANAYQTASVIPEAIFFIIAGGALGSAFIPTFSGYFARGDLRGAWRLFSAVINLVTVVLVVVCSIVFIFADELLLLYLPDISRQAPEFVALTARLLRVLLISTVIFGVSGVFMGALNARQHFIMPAIAPIVYNLGIIGGAVFVAPNVMGLAWGAVAGAAGHLLIQLPALHRQQATYAPIFTIRDPGVRQVLRLMAPRVLGLSFSQINVLVIPYLASLLGFAFSIAPLRFAWRIVLMPQSILGQAVGIAAFPTFATLAAEQALPAMRRILTDTLRLISFIAIPATLLLILLAEPLVRVALERGAFTSEDTALVAFALAFFAPALLALAAIEVVSRAFYALEDTLTPVLAGGLQLAVMSGLGLILSGWIFPQFGLPQLGGLALAISVSNLLEAVLLYLLLRRKMHGVDGYRLVDGLWRMAVAGAILWAVSWLTRRAFSGDAPLLELFVVSAVGGATYLLAAWMLQLSELRQLAAYGRRRLSR